MSAPRLVLVHRRTQLEELLAEHSTIAAVEFFLSTRGQDVDPLVAADEAQQRALAEAANAVPLEWRQAVVERSQLSRFLFEPDDVVVVVGQDGLVANVAKYLGSQVVLGISPVSPGLLCGHGVAGRAEEQSSSGLIVGTGTGATGWLASLWMQTRPGFELPTVESSDLAYFVREAWPSPVTGTSLVAGLVAQDDEVRVRAQSSLVAFGDGIERDHLRIEWGQELTLRRASRTLHLVDRLV